MRKTVFCSLIIALIFFAPIATRAIEGAPIGTECTPADNNDMCASGDCEKSNIDNGSGGHKWYCDCNFDDDCDIYGAPKSGDWDCEDGYEATYNLDYCVDENGDKTSADVKAPKGMNPNFSVDDILTVLFGNREVLQQKILSSITDDINDKMAIRIPGLNFSKLSVVADNDGYLYIPWLGEYIKAIYNYALGIISIVAVIVIILQGGRIIASGGGEGKQEGLKKIGHVVIGLVIAWSSYAILYTINPNLTEFKPLKIAYIVPRNLDYLEGGDSDGSAETQDAIELGFTCPKTGGTDAIPAVVSSMDNKVAYRFGGKGKSGPPFIFSETAPQYSQYNNNCPANNACLDCSGFINYVYTCAGLSSPGGGTKSIFSGAELIEKIDLDANTVNEKPLQPGDLLGWIAGDKGQAIGHVVMYIGDGEIAESYGGDAGRQPGANPRLAKTSQFKNYKFTRIRRVR